jgi:hypothetical protein
MRPAWRRASVKAMSEAVTRVQLEALVGEIRHVREEHRRAHVGGSVRRGLHTRLAGYEDDFERLLAEWVPSEQARNAWRAHLHHGEPAPAAPPAGRPVAYRGRSGAGSVVEVRELGGGTYEVRVDGCLTETVAAELDFAGTRVPHTLVVDGRTFQETFAASERALKALEEFVAERDPRPPWRYAAELLADGLVDRTVALTPRGHRALAVKRRAAA